MSLEADLVTLIKADSAVTAMIGGRIGALHIRQGAALPYAVMQRISSEPVQELSAGSVLEFVTIQIDMIASSYVAAKNLAIAMRVALDGKSGGNIEWVRYTQEFDGYDPQTEHPRVIHEYRVSYRQP